MDIYKPNYLAELTSDLLSLSPGEEYWIHLYDGTSARIIDLEGSLALQECHFGEVPTWFDRVLPKTESGIAVILDTMKGWT